MFSNCSRLTEFNATLPSSGLTSVDSMFSGCTSLSEWTGVLPSGLTTANSMFYGCTSLTEFSADLPSGLTDADFMFYSCKLNKPSVQRIADTIPDVRGVSGSHSITIGIKATLITQEEQNAFNATIVGKGWTTTWQRR